MDSIKHNARPAMNRVRWLPIIASVALAACATAPKQAPPPAARARGGRPR
jgi:hypothetical protein